MCKDIATIYPSSALNKTPSPTKGEKNHVEPHEAPYIIHANFDDRHSTISLWLRII